MTIDLNFYYVKRWVIEAKLFAFPDRITVSVENNQ